MRKCFLLARSNLRKSKGQAFAIFALILLAAAMLNLWLMLSMDYKQNFTRYHEKLHAGHVSLVADQNAGEMRKFLSQVIESDGRSDGFAIDDAMQMVGQFAYHGGEVNLDFVIMEKQAALSRSVEKIEIVEDGGGSSGIYMPMLYKSDGIEAGKTVQITIGSHEMSYTVCGFFNSVMAGSHNCAITELVMTKDKYDELAKTGYAPKAAFCSVRLKDADMSEDYEAMLQAAVSSRYPDARAVSNSYALVATSRYISQMICSGILNALALVILLIALVVIASNIVNYIQENMQNLGALKAVGYTGLLLAGSLAAQFLFLALIAAIAGIIISYGVFPFVNEMMIAQTGIPYAVRFLPLPCLLTVAMLGGAVVFVTCVSARRIQKTEPVVALRQGMGTHNFKRNHVPLDTARAPLSLALALKTTLSGVKHNVTVCVTMLALSLVVVFSGVMTENMIADMTSFICLIVGETADSCIDVNARIEDDFLRSMQADGQVETIYLYHSTKISHAGGAEITAIICDDYEKVTNQSVVFQGRFPKYDNEIAIAAKYAKEQGLKEGDEITVTACGKEADYIITGLTQISNNLGKDCLLTRDGYERMGKLQNTSYYIHLLEGTDVEAFHEKARGQFGEDVNATIAVKSVIDGTASVYVSLMKIIVIAILVLSMAVIAFVLYLLVRTMINNKKREYGIMKALGFTTRQLVFQTAASFMPAVFLSTALGLAISACIINPLTALFLRGIGIVKCTFTVPFGFVAAGGIGLALSAFGIACLLSLRIRKITPREMLAGE